MNTTGKITRRLLTQAPAPAYAYLRATFDQDDFFSPSDHPTVLAVLAYEGAKVPSQIPPLTGALEYNSKLQPSLTNRPDQDLFPNSVSQFSSSSKCALKFDVKEGKRIYITQKKGEKRENVLVENAFAHAALSLSSHKVLPLACFGTPTRISEFVGADD